VYQRIATTLRLHDEAQFEAGAGAPEMVAERDAVLRLVRDAQAVFLALLEVSGHRLNVDLRGSYGPAHEHVRALAAAIADVLGLAADRIEGRPTGPQPDLRRLLARAEDAVANVPAVVHLQARLLLYHDLVGTVVLLDRDVDALEPHVSPAAARAAASAPR
jgi:hypothetical protein